MAVHLEPVDGCLSESSLSLTNDDLHDVSGVVVAVDRTVVDLSLNTGDVGLEAGNHGLLGLRVEVQDLIASCDFRVVQVEHRIDAHKKLLLGRCAELVELGHLRLLSGNLSSLDKVFLFAGCHLQKAKDFALTLELDDELISNALISYTLLEC